MDFYYNDRILFLKLRNAAIFKELTHGKRKMLINGKLFSRNRIYPHFNRAYRRV